MTKKQHYVPKMYLKNFCFDENKCYFYSRNQKKINKRNISDICCQNKFYEFMNEKKEVLCPSNRNLLEKIFSKIETEDAELLKHFIKLCLETREEYILVEPQMKDGLIGFMAFLMYRNPVFKYMVPKVYEDYFKRKLNVEESFYVWIIEFEKNIQIWGNEMLKGKITILKTNPRTPFITSNIPFYFEGYELHKNFYMPLSSCIALKMEEPDSESCNLNIFELKTLNESDVLSYNSLLTYSKSDLVCCDESMLKKRVKMGEKICQ